MNERLGPASAVAATATTTITTASTTTANFFARAITALALTVTVSGTSFAVTEAQTLYQQTCVVCHGKGMHGAPIPGVASDWQQRLSYGIDEIYLNVIEGLGNTMPARGACDDCSDQQLEAIVDYMLEDSH